MAKTIEFGTSPRKEKQDQLSSDKWVNNKETLKRFTIDIPEELHIRIKTICASKGVKMREEIIRVFENHFSAND
jgi:hypothetical protein